MLFRSMGMLASSGSFDFAQGRLFDSRAAAGSFRMTESSYLHSSREAFMASDGARSHPLLRAVESFSNFSWA